MENYYEILGVSQSATDDQLKKAYLKQIKIYHPDVYQGDKAFAEEKTRQITEAYTVLKGYLTRKGYDEKLKKQTKDNDTSDKNTSEKEQSTSNSQTQETKENNEKESEKEYNPNFSNDARENIKKDRKHKNSDKKSKNKEEDKQEDNQENIKSEEEKSINKILEASREPLSKSELKDKKILNIIILTLMFLLVLSIIMTFVTIH